jgi:CHAD domain
MNEVAPLRSLHPAMPLIGAVREILLAQLATLATWAIFLPQPDRAYEHHQMRIAAKRLRYSLDMCAEILPAELLECIKDLKVLQDALGELHDIDVQFESIEQAIDTLHQPRKRKRREEDRVRDAAQRISLEALASVTAERRSALHHRSLAVWQDIETRDVFAHLRHTFGNFTTLPEAALYDPPYSLDGGNIHE